MKKYFSLFVIVMLGIIGFRSQAVTINLKLTPGSVANVMQYTSGEYTLYQALKEGDNSVEWNDRMIPLYIRPAQDATITVDPEVEYCVYKDSRDEMYILKFYPTIDGQTFTVTTSGGSGSGKPSANFILEAGAKARVMELNERTGEYTLHAELHEGDNPVEFEMESQFIPGTVPFYRLCGEEGYILDEVNADGKAVTPMTDAYLGNYVELNVFNLAKNIKVKTKERPAPEGDPTFILSDGSRAYYTFFGGGNKINMSSGDNYVEVPYSTSILVYAADGLKFKSFTDGNGQQMPVTNGYVKIDGYGFNPPYNITTEIDDEPELTITVDVDAPDKIECLLLPTGRAIALRSGETEIKLKKSREPQLQITNTGLSFPEFYMVTVNGEPLEHSYFHTINVEDGMKIVARRNFPEVNVTYNIEYLNESGDFWTTIVDDNGKEYQVVDNKLTVPAGTCMEMYNTNALDWKIKQVVLPNGKIIDKINPPYPVTFIARDNGVIKVDAEMAQEIEIIINIASDAADVRVFNGDLNFNNELSGLKNGANRKTIKDNNYNYVIVRHIDQFTAVKSVSYRETANSEIKSAEYDSRFHYFTVPNLRHRSEIFINGGEPAGVESVIVGGGDGKAEYFDLTGRKVDAENLLPGLYIRVSAGRSEKVVIK